MTEEKALAIKGSTSLTPFHEIRDMAQACFESHMFTDLKTAAQAIVKMQAGNELGLPPIYSLQRLYMAEGKLGMSAETMGALIKRSGKYNYMVKEHTDQKCTIIFYENGQEVYPSTFTMADAQRANLVKPNSGWVKYPRALLFSRALSQGARIVAPDALGGAYTLEELEGIKSAPIDNEPVTESRNEEAPPDVDIGDVDTAHIDTETAYSAYLDSCPEHGDQWKVNKYGKRGHYMPNKEYCNFSKQIGPVLEKLSKEALMGKDDLKQWLKDNYEGRSWSKLSEEEQVDVLDELQEMVDTLKSKAEGNPLVKAAVDAGGKITSIEPKEGEDNGK